MPPLLHVEHVAGLICVTTAVNAEVGAGTVSASNDTATQFTGVVKGLVAENVTRIRYAINRRKQNCS